MAEYIYQMVRARKAVGEKLILDDVTMSFIPGAKIGMVGPNGAGKSTILKIMAGLDQPSNGEAKLSPGFTVSILTRRPSDWSASDVGFDNEDEGYMGGEHARAAAADPVGSRGRHCGHLSACSWAELCELATLWAAPRRVAPTLRLGSDHHRDASWLVEAVPTFSRAGLAPSTVQ